MNHDLVPAQNQLIDCLQVTARGPRQSGIFALWLLLRTCDDALPPMTLSGRATKRRIDAMVKRWSSLSMQPAIKRALARSAAELALGTDSGIVAALQNLEGPTREYLGQDAANAVTLAVRSAKRALRLERTTA
ncbi:MAG: hypothetical protein JSW71_01390 [Gemmatimonadota bacterium]|nr:MAG: hypothetical protein JSW71_01390 [Gemmatimonadota bacterium]